MHVQGLLAAVNRLPANSCEPEALKLIEFCERTHPPCGSLSTHKKNQLTRWSVALLHSQPPLPKTYPRSREEALDYYWRLKHWMQCSWELLKPHVWRNFFDRAIHPRDLETGLFDSQDKGSSPDVFWSRFDAAVSRWIDDLPQRGWDTGDEWCLSKKLVSIGAPAANYLSWEMQPLILKERADLMMEVMDWFYQHPNLHYLYYFLDSLRHQLQLEKRLRLQVQDFDQPELVQYYDDKTPLPSEGIVFEYMWNIVYRLSVTMWGLQMPVSCDSCCESCQ